MLKATGPFQSTLILHRGYFCATAASKSPTSAQMKSEAVETSKPSVAAFLHTVVKKGLLCPTGLNPCEPGSLLKDLSLNLRYTSE